MTHPDRGHTPLPSVWRWRPCGATNWIYDPTQEWLEDHKHEIECEPVYTAADHAALKARVAELEKALEFYADPVAWKRLHDPEDVVRIPDFYYEMSFEDTARAVLADKGAGK